MHGALVRSAAFVLLAFVPGCVVDLTLPNDVLIACAADTDCRDGRVCREEQCIAPGDDEPPRLTGAQSLGNQRVELSFSEPMAPGPASDLASYAIAGLALTDAVPSLDRRSVILSTSAQLARVYTIAVLSTRSTAARSSRSRASRMVHVRRRAPAGTRCWRVSSSALATHRPGRPACAASAPIRARSPAARTKRRRSAAARAIVSARRGQRRTTPARSFVLRRAPRMMNRRARRPRLCFNAFHDTTEARDGHCGCFCARPGGSRRLLVERLSGAQNSEGKNEPSERRRRLERRACVRAVRPG